MVLAHKALYEHVHVDFVGAITINWRQIIHNVVRITGEHSLVKQCGLDLVIWLVYILSVSH